MSILVEQQDETLDVIEETAAHVEKDTEAGLGHTMKAVDSARAARKKRWICFGLFALLLVIVAIIIAVVVLQNRKSK
jgi:syntaxin 1B/2/3